MRIRIGSPGCATGDLLKAEVLIEFDRTRVVITDVEPDSMRPFVTGMLHSPLSKNAGYAAATIIGMCRDICHEINTFAMIPKWDQTGVTHNFAVLLPHVTS